MNNTITVHAKFIGKNWTAGYITNEKYLIALKSTKDYAVVIESYGDQIPYESIVSFLKNWIIIKVNN